MIILRHSINKIYNKQYDLKKMILILYNGR